MTWKFELQEIKWMVWIDWTLIWPTVGLLPPFYRISKEYIQRKSLKSTSKSTILTTLDVWTDWIQNQDVSMHIVIYVDICIYVYIYIHISIYTDIIYNTPAQRFVSHNFSLHSWCLKKKARLQQQSFCVTLCSDLGRNAKKIPSCLSLDISSGWANPVIHHHEILFINMNKISGFVWMHLCFFDRRLVERWELDFPNLEWIAGNCFDSYSDILYVHWCYDWTYSRASYFAAMEHLCLVLFIFR